MGQVEEIPKPFTRNAPPAPGVSPLNIRERLLRCNYCKYEIVSDVPAPVCGKCGQNLITVVVTNNVQLAE